MKEKIELFFNNIKIKNKLILSYLIVAFATVSIVSTYLTVRMNKIVVDKSINDAASHVNTMRYNLEETLKLATRISDTIYADQNLASLLTTNFTSNSDVVKAYNNYTLIDNYLKYYTELSSITIYVKNDTLLSSSTIQKTNNSITSQNWYQKAVSEDGKIFWKYWQQEPYGDKYLSLIRAIYSYNGQLLGVLVINLNNDSLKTITSPDYKNNILALDKNTFTLDNNYNFPKKLSGNIIKRSGKANYYVVKSKVDDEENYVIINSFQIPKSIMNTFQTLIIMPEAKITQQTNGVIAESILIVFITIIISFFIILYFSRGMSNRINILRQQMHQVVNGDFNIPHKISGNDEIGQLYNDMIFMLKSIKNLINQVYVQKIKEEKLKAGQKEAEFKMLSSQINPHFLYNTLETIRMKAFCNGDKEIADIVKKLGKIMRRNLEVSGKPVTLKSELDLLENYLEIQSIRFEGMVKYNVYVDKSINTSEYMIIPLLLQPVVENAFVHGLEEKKEKGTINISINTENDDLIITIRDNGIGIDDKKLIELNKIINTKNCENKSIGIRNVNQRIKIYYGKNYGLALTSKYGIGTSVKINLPMEGCKC